MIGKLLFLKLVMVKLETEYAYSQYQSLQNQIPHVLKRTSLLKNLITKTKQSTYQNTLRPSFLDLWFQLLKKLKTLQKKSIVLYQILILQRLGLIKNCMRGMS